MKKLTLILFLLISVSTYANDYGFYGKYTAQYIPSKKDYERYLTNRNIKSVYYSLLLIKNKNNGISIHLEKTIKAEKEYIQLYIYNDLIVRKERNKYRLYESSTGEIIATVKGNKITYESDGYIDLVLVKR